MLMLSVKDEKEAELYLSAPALQAENKALKDMLREVLRAVQTSQFDWEMKNVMVELCPKISALLKEE